MNIGMGLGMACCGSRMDIEAATAALFAAGEQGAWYDPSDFSTLFQDSAGTTPFTTIGQPVGKILDKSGRGNHATQPTSGSRLTVGQDANGKYYFASSGTPQHMLMPFIAVPTDMLCVSGVVIDSNTGLHRSIWTQRDTTAALAQGDILYAGPTNWEHRQAISGSFVTLTGAAVALATKTLVKTLRAPSSSKLTVNAAEVTSTPAAYVATASAGRLMAGGGSATIEFYTPGKLYGFILRAGAPSAAQIATAEAWMSAKLGT